MKKDMKIKTEKIRNLIFLPWIKKIDIGNKKGRITKSKRAWSLKLIKENKCRITNKKEGK